MADDITNGELARRLDDLKNLLGGLVGRPEYEADQRAGAHWFDDIGRDLAALQTQHDRDIKALRDELAEAHRVATEHRQSWRTVIYTGLIPAAVVLLGILAQLWIAGGGHK